MISDVLNERENQYGDFATLAPMAQTLKRLFRQAPGAAKLTDVQVEVLENIAVKLARILNGNPLIADNWQDIAGYASLAHEELIAAALPAPKEVKTPVIKPNSYEAVEGAVLPGDPLPVFLTNTGRPGDPNDHRGNGKKDKSL